MAEATSAALGLLEFLHLDESRVLHGLDDELGDPFTPDDLEILGRVGVDQQHLEFAPVTRIDQTRGIEARDAVLERQAAAGLHEAGVTVRNGDGDTRGNKFAVAAGTDRDVDRTPEVHAGIAGFGEAWHLEIGSESDDRDLHVAQVRASPGTITNMLVWMDLEMTGLDSTKHVIVEIATLVTDDELNIVAEGPNLVVHQPESALALMDKVVVDMHTKSGLLEQIRSSTITLEQAGAETLAFIKEHVPAARTVPLCGNSIGMDRRFLDAYLPEIEEWLHYRSIDVSTLKELARRWYPTALSDAPRKATAHRAMDDIVESVKGLAHWRSTIFRDPSA